MGNNESKIKNLIELSKSYIESNQFESAIICYKKLLKIDPKDTNALIDMVNAYNYL